MQCPAWDASQTMPKSMREREGRHPLAERGRLVDSARACTRCLADSAKGHGRTHWLYAGASWSVPRGHVTASRPGPTGWTWAPHRQCQGHVRDASRTVPKGMGEPTGCTRAPRGQRLKGIDCEKAGTHWLNVGASWSVPRGHARDASQTMPIEHEKARWPGPTG